METPRYRAMRGAFDRRGPAGRTMMYSTAGLQVCLDAGEAGAGSPPAGRRCTRSARRCWPRSPPPTGTPAGDTGWASARMAAWLASTRPAPARSGRRSAADEDPAAAWAGTCSPRRCSACAGDGPDWTPPAGVTFADWLDGALPRPPTTDDLDYHVSTLFPPVRPRGYLEVRYLDAQPGRDWIAAARGAGRAARRPGHRPPRRTRSPPRWPTAGTRPPGTAWPTRPSPPPRAALLDLALAALPRLDLPAAIARRDRPRRTAATRRRGEGSTGDRTTTTAGARTAERLRSRIAAELERTRARTALLTDAVDDDDLIASTRR